MFRLKPLTAEDVDNQVESELVGTLSLEPTFIVNVRDRMKESKADSYMRYSITLADCVPVINNIICGSLYTRVAKIFGLKSILIRGLANFEMAWDRSIKEIVYAESAEDPLYNGAGLLEVIKEFKPKEVLFGLLREQVWSIFSSDDIEVKVGLDQKLPLYGDIRCTVWNKETGEDLTEICPEKIQFEILRKIQASKFDRINILMNLWNGCGRSDEKVREYLSSALIIRYVIVLPYNLRPSMGNKKHPLTMLYSKLYKENTDVYIYQANGGEDFKEHYRKIAELVDSITNTNHARSTDIKALDPLISRMKTKETGLIRANMLKKRQDYSGRSAVIVDPFMPIDKVGMPKSMAIKLFRWYLTSSCGMNPVDVLEHLNNADFEERAIKALEKSGILESVPVIVGRNPTLHKHGIQGFYAVLNDNRALQMNPLVCPAYNMDFDGDSAHTEVFNTLEAVNELVGLVLTDKNILLPKTGACTICPEKDVVYGLYMCTCIDYAGLGTTKTFDTLNSLRESFYNMQTFIWDLVNVGRFQGQPAGLVLVLSCFPSAVRDKIGTEPITQDVIKSYIKHIQGLSRESFDVCVNSLVELGMRTAYIYTKSVSVLKPLNSVEEFDTVVDKFDASMQAVYELNDLGFYDADGFSYDLGQRLEIVNETLKNKIYEKMPDNMFLTMAKSGARGNPGNLVQIFGSKGRIQKNEREAFNIFIRNGMNNHLTAMDGSIAAYGARKGQIAKSIKTADTGYLGRKMNHSSNSIIITELDCGTNQCLTVDFKDIRKYEIKETSTDEDKEKIDRSTEETMKKFLVGRYLFGDDVLVTDKLADSLVAKHGQVKIRSPLTCKNPCCKYCYGINPATGKLPAIGTAVGLLASTSTSEPSTQMTMKEFQSGGVVNAGSPFDRVDSLMCMTDIRAKCAAGEYPSYDPIAWAPGVLEAQEYSGSQLLLRIVPTSKEDVETYNYKSNRLVPNTVRFKVGQKVEKGEFLRVERGDCYAPEVIQVAGIEVAQRELIYNLYYLFKKQVNLVPVHLEVMVSSFTGYMSIYAKSENLRFGKYYTKRLLYDMGIELNDKDFIADIRGVNRIVLGSPNFMEALIMSNPKDAISEAVLNCLIDINDSPLVQLATGQRVKVGTGYNPKYIEEMT